MLLTVLLEVPLKVTAIQRKLKNSVLGLMSVLIER